MAGGFGCRGVDLFSRRRDCSAAHRGVGRAPVSSRGRHGARALRPSPGKARVTVSRQARARALTVRTACALHPPTRCGPPHGLVRRADNAHAATALASRGASRPGSMDGGPCRGRPGGAKSHPDEPRRRARTGRVRPRSETGSHRPGGRRFPRTRAPRCEARRHTAKSRRSLPLPVPRNVARVTMRGRGEGGDTIKAKGGGRRFWEGVSGDGMRGGLKGRAGARLPCPPPPPLRGGPMQVAARYAAWSRTPLTGEEMGSSCSLGFFLPREGEGDRNAIEGAHATAAFWWRGPRGSADVPASRSGPRIKSGDRVPFGQ